MAWVRTFAFAALALGAVRADSRAPRNCRRKPRRRSRPTARAPGKKCNVGGMTGVLAANGVCVRLSGSVSAWFGAGQIK